MKDVNLSNLDIALYALYRLGGISKKIHTELIAWDAFKLTPERFSWRLPEFRDREFVDKTPVRHALEQAQKQSKGRLVKGRAGGDAGGLESEGWTFTPDGAVWIKQNETRIAEELKLKSTKMHPREAGRFIRRIKDDIAYVYYRRDSNLNQVTPYMFTDMLGCTPDASKEIIVTKFNRILSLATILGDESIIDFLVNCKKQFSSLMNEKS
jgi:hypothetical protein